MFIYNDPESELMEVIVLATSLHIIIILFYFFPYLFHLFFPLAFITFNHHVIIVCNLLLIVLLLMGRLGWQ